MGTGKNVGATAGSIGGAALGNVLLPGIGGYLGGAAGGFLGRTVGGIFDKDGPAKEKPDALAAFVASLQTPGEMNPFETAGYQGRLGAVLDGLREDREDDAGRAFAFGLAPGMALASGAGARSKALAGAVRSAAGDAEGRVNADERFRKGQLLQALGLEADLDERERARKERERSGWLNTLFKAGATGAELYLNSKGQGTPKNETADQLLRREIGMS